MVEGHRLSAQDVLAVLCVTPTLLDCDQPWLDKEGALPMFFNDVKLKVHA